MMLEETASLIRLGTLSLFPKMQLLTVLYFPLSLFLSFEKNI